MNVLILLTYSYLSVGISPQKLVNLFPHYCCDVLSVKNAVTLHYTKITSAMGLLTETLHIVMSFY